MTNLQAPEPPGPLDKKKTTHRLRQRHAAVGADAERARGPDHVVRARRAQQNSAVPRRVENCPATLVSTRRHGSSKCQLRLTVVHDGFDVLCGGAYGGVGGDVSERGGGIAGTGAVDVAAGGEGGGD